MRSIPYPDPPLEDDVLRLRPWTPDDIPAALEAGQDEHIARHTSLPADEEGVRRFYEAQARGRERREMLQLAVAAGPADAFLGSVSLVRFDWAECRGEIGYWIVPWARGRGLAVRAVRLVAPWALTALGLERLELLADVGNVPSQRVAESAGFTREGILRSYATIGGERCDLVMYSLLPRDLTT